MLPLYDSIILETDPATIASRVSRPRADTTEIQINEQSEQGSRGRRTSMGTTYADSVDSLLPLLSALMSAYSSLKERLVMLLRI